MISNENVTFEQWRDSSFVSYQFHRVGLKNVPDTKFT